MKQIVISIQIKDDATVDVGMNTVDVFNITDEYLANKENQIINSILNRIVKVLESLPNETKKEN